MDFEQFAADAELRHKVAKEAVTYLVISYPNWKMSESFAKVWIEELKDMPDERALYNAKEWVRAGNEFPPSLAKLMTANDHIEAEKAKRRTQEAMKIKESGEYAPPPWLEYNMTRQEWFEQVIFKKRGKQ